MERDSTVCKICYEAVAVIDRRMLLAESTSYRPSIFTMTTDALYCGSMDLAVGHLDDAMADGQVY